jgi:hypothetical protein
MKSQNGIQFRSSAGKNIAGISIDTVKRFFGALPEIKGSLALFVILEMNTCISGQ